MLRNRQIIDSENSFDTLEAIDEHVDDCQEKYDQMPDNTQAEISFPTQPPVQAPPIRGKPVELRRIYKESPVHDQGQEISDFTANKKTEEDKQKLERWERSKPP